MRDHLSNNDVDIYIKLFSLLYADDTIVLAENASDLQSALNGVKDYCETWKLRVNTSNTKVVVFSRGKIRRRPDFFLGNERIEVVDDYTYLGVTFNYNNNLLRLYVSRLTKQRRPCFVF